MAALAMAALVGPHAQAEAASAVREEATWAEAAALAEVGVIWVAGRVWEAEAAQLMAAEAVVVVHTASRLRF
ncbi:MAG TPA: hypothetical protein VLT57_13650 [Bryobacteraceae bacterium]|nr:hypothetical protein [Bryobacteraceae bacterium]